FSRTMEHLRRWGIADRARFPDEFPSNYPLNIGFFTSIDGQLLAAFPGLTNEAIPSASSAISPEGPVICPKRISDPLLRDAELEVSGGESRYLARVDSVDQQEAGVTAVITVVQPGARCAVRPQYLVACEGGHGQTRTKLGIIYAGSFAQGRNV